MRNTCPASIYGTLEKYLELTPQGKNSNKNTALKSSHPHSDTLLESLPSSNLLYFFFSLGSHSHHLYSELMCLHVSIR